MRIFILDDDSTLRFMLQKILESEGYEVFSYSEPSQFLCMCSSVCGCKHHEVCGDVLISDIEMPGIRGIQLVQSLQNNGCKIKHIALMSSTWSTEEWQTVVHAGYRAFEKPLDTKKLLRWLADCTRQIESERVLVKWKE